MLSSNLLSQEIDLIALPDTRKGGNIYKCRISRVCVSFDQSIISLNYSRVTEKETPHSVVKLVVGVGR